MKKFEIRLKAGHPTGIYHRGGLEFRSHISSAHIPDPVTLTEDELTNEIKNDLWLEIREVPADLA